MSERELVEVDVAGGELAVAVYRPEAEPTLPPILALHGITGSSMLVHPVARELSGEAFVAAPDLRGRGLSHELPPPYGLWAHADDCAAVVKALGLEPVIAVGESMGGFVAVLFAAKYPELVRSIVLVDGGLPLGEPPPDMPVEAVMAAVLGPATERLKMTFESEAAYLDYWRAHPALGEEWSSDVEDYLLYDLIGEAPELRSRVVAAAVEADTVDHIIEPRIIADPLETLRCPITMLRATRGLLNQPEPLYADALVDPWRERLPQLEVEVVGDTNHYTLAVGKRGVERIVAAVRAIA